MAKYTLQYSCGHVGVENLIGPHKNREWAIQYKQRGLCPECYREEAQKKHDEENTLAAQYAQENELPLLVGSEKQVAYAETCRKKLIQIAEKTLASKSWLHELSFNGIDEEKANLIFNYMLSITSARWWIDNYKGDSIVTTFVFLSLDLPKDFMISNREEEDIMKFTAIPENAVSKSIATISVDGDVLRIKFPEKNEDFRILVKKKLHTTWVKDHWSRILTWKQGDPADRMAEAGNLLLANGFGVCIRDEKVLQNAIEGHFEFEKTRWIFKTTTHRFVGITWDRNKEDFYYEAKKLPTALKQNHAILVDAVYMDDIIDFAKRWDFSIRPQAMKMMEEAKKEHEETLRVRVEVAESVEAWRKENPRFPTLLAEEVEIDEEFRDDNETNAPSKGSD